VLETYTVDASGGIRLTAMVFDHEGPNLPHGPERGSTWNFLGPRVMVTGYSILLDEMNIAIAAGQRLECGQWEWDMESAVGRDTPVRVRIERVPIICIQATRVLQSKTLTVRY
jgi:hypothetical protein